ncbi:CDP-diacylglycerol--glycerol-3-phosphate 3-phosphatidyltransferase [Aureliella helgolandensis]|uniref:CDP-diacylglycerol--glycerol-3-phosphate 3-phosphatidyltransferase n=1 Tax=Aureliella helgolandensis TaxID=2527968 RepID=A0A518G8Y4_9BACT|nr:CDP-diacylglycerol--glycerol-3-phosphate 3-phosphatidyltransferase [Aureliella helgolandensis]QDV25058.1 CDP-diacylglycerol--glycerol-3-phosphate 3-phosphatidyltransferase [Aureliella helgolandensis]
MAATTTQVEHSDQSPASAAGDQIWNVPNALSMARLGLAFFVGILIEFQQFMPALFVFVVAASTDFVDGWWARKFNQVTKLGRVLDPFVDKIIITAALIALVGCAGSGIDAWMVTVIVGREFLVTSIRAMVEGKGGDFSARSLGKWKMLFQCAAVVSSLLLLDGVTDAVWLVWTTSVLIWLAVLMTVASGADYVIQAVRLARNAS